MNEMKYFHIKLEIAESGKALGIKVSSSDCSVVVCIPARTVGGTGSNPVSQKSFRDCSL